MINQIKIKLLLQDGGSAHDLFTDLGIIYRKYIKSLQTSIVDFRHFHSFSGLLFPAS